MEVHSQIVAYYTVLCTICVHPTMPIIIANMQEIKFGICFLVIISSLFFHNSFVLSKCKVSSRQDTTTSYIQCVYW